jgi:DNA-binding transcriptional LysR family regulator
MTRRHYNLPSLYALAAFEAVARQLNVTRAAEVMNITLSCIPNSL